MNGRVQKSGRHHAGPLRAGTLHITLSLVSSFEKTASEQLSVEEPSRRQCAVDTSGAMATFIGGGAQGRCGGTVSPAPWEAEQSRLSP